MSDQETPENEIADSGYQPQRNRSPAYPLISLREAVELAAKLYDKHRFNKVPITIALNDLGYSTSGTGYRVVAALSHYGLAEAEGNKESRRIQITALTRSIILENPNNPSMSLDAIKTAALMPEMHQWVISNYQLGEGGTLPTDAQLMYDLVTDMGFTEKAAKSFIDEFKETYEYARLGDVGENLVTTEPQQPESNPKKEILNLQNTMTDFFGIKPPAQPQKPPEEHTIRLTQGKKAQLILPAKLNQKDMAMLIGWLQVVLDGVIYDEEHDQQSH